MYWDRIPRSKYERFTRVFSPSPGAVRQWAALAGKAGMKYMVLTAKHHDGFCLWDSRVTPYNAARSGARRDLVAEYVEACRKQGLRVGLYYSLLDWHHPDCARAAKSASARRRFVDYTHALVRELMSNYGRIDVLWYDGEWPLDTAEQWRSRELNAMVRSLQPDILINNRSRLDEDFGTPEQSISAAVPGRAWEACMTFTSQNVSPGVWGWRPDPPEDWVSTRNILDMLRKAASGGGNLLMNIGPRGDGSVPDIARKRLLEIGRWLRGNEEAVYGQVDRVTGEHFPPWMVQGKWTLKGNVGYFWYRQWVGTELVIAEMKTKVRRITYLKTGKPVRFTRKGDTIVLRNLPPRNPDRIAGTTVFRIEFAGVPRHRPNPGHVLD